VTQDIVIEDGAYDPDNAKNDIGKAY